MRKKQEANMNEKQWQAYKWAKNQGGQSVESDYAKELARLVEKLTEELEAYRELGTVEELGEALYNATL